MSGFSPKCFSQIDIFCSPSAVLVVSRHKFVIMTACLNAIYQKEMSSPDASSMLLTMPFHNACRFSTLPLR